MNPDQIELQKAMFLSRPKIELHRHLECSLRLSTLKELAFAHGLPVAQSDTEIRKQWLVTEPMTDLEAVLSKFLVTQKVLSSAEILTRITFEAIEDAARENIRLLELRYAPTYIRQGHEHLSFAQIHAAILQGIEMAKHLPIAVGLIATIQRNRPLREAGQVIDFVIENQASFLAIDLADNEVGFDPAPFAAHFQRAKRAGLHVTVHTAEANVAGSAEKVRDAIELLGADRIGHGVQIAKSKSMLDLVKAAEVPLELCPTSNWLTQAVARIEDHPLRRLLHEGILLTLNSDDPGVFAIDLTNEYAVASHDLGLTLTELDRIEDIAAAASFLPIAMKQKYWPRQIDPKLAPHSV